MLKIGTLFSGIGAFEQALNKLNIKHQILFACDNDRFVKQSYFANYDIDDNRWYNDIFDINGKKYRGKIDLLVGGSPCQSFSAIGFREGLKDKRGLLIFEFTRLIEEIQPKVFIFENVKGLLSHDKGKTWNYILKEFKSTGYYIKYQLLNAKDYGMPQSRIRLFVVGFKKKNNFEFPRPIQLEKKMSDFLEHVFISEQSISQKAKEYVLNKDRMRKKITQVNGNIMLCQVRNQQSNLIGDFVSESFINSYNELDYSLYYRERERERERVLESQQVSDQYLEQFVLSSKLQNTILQRGKPNLEVAKTILSTSWKYHYASIDNYVSYDNDRIRRLTPRECLRLMGFSDDFKIVVSNTQAYRQSGNSIVVNVFEQLLPKIFQVTNFDMVGSSGNNDTTSPPSSHDDFTSPNLSLTLLRSLTISNEYVYPKHKHGISETHGQSKIKFTKKEFSEIFGNQMKGRIHFNKKTTLNFLNNLKTRWEKMEKTDLENHKNPNLEFIAQKINQFQEKYAEASDLVEQEYCFTEYSKDRYALVIDIFKEIVYYVAVPFETFIDILKDKQNNLYISFGIDFSLIKNSLLAKRQKEITPTKKEKNRKGQAKLREELIKKYKKCQITELTQRELLIASHIKPYGVSEEDEEYDLDNVLLLNATFDKLLDAGLMSFDKNDYLVFSDMLSPEDIYKLKKLIINYHLNFSEKQKEYVNFHRNTVFRVMNWPITTSDIGWR